MTLRNAIKHFLGRYPSLFYPAFKLLGSSRLQEECLLNERSKLVIEGFPRSANTFSVVAFRYAQGEDVEMAHHLHVECQIISGVQRKIPVIALIRAPDDAVRSLLIREKNISSDEAFKRYFQFYSAVKKVRSQIVLADFSVVTNNYSAVIQEVNSKYGTEFKLYENSSENEKEVNQRIDSINADLDGGQETHVARPSTERKKISVDLGDSIYRKKSKAIYKELSDLVCSDI